jgi:mRNA interferase MazF
LVDLGMTAKVRPCLVLSIPVLDADRAQTTLLPHTTSIRGSRFEIEVRASFLEPGAFDAQNLITIPHARLMSKLGVLSRAQLVAIETTLRFWLGL